MPRRRFLAGSGSSGHRGSPMRRMAQMRQVQTDLWWCARPVLGAHQEARHKRRVPDRRNGSTDAGLARTCGILPWQPPTVPPCAPVEGMRPIWPRIMHSGLRGLDNRRSHDSAPLDGVCRELLAGRLRYGTLVRGRESNRRSWPCRGRCTTSYGPRVTPPIRERRAAMGDQRIDERFVEVAGLRDAPPPRGLIDDD